MDGRGPTTGAERHIESTRRWEAHPRLASAARVLLFVTPLLAAVFIGFVASATIPPERIGMNRWLWLGLLFVCTTVVLIVIRRGLRRLTPLIALMELTLIFPDQAPSRSRAMLRRSNSRTMLRRIEEARAEGDGAVGGEVSYGDYLVQLLNEVNDHDRLTRGHSERVRAYAEMLGEELDLTDDEMNKLRWAALLHDVGKLDVPEEILNKNGKPTDEEWQVLSGHPAAGGRMLAPLADWLGEWVHAADQHHCRYDGGGYPTALKGEEITLAGRIVAVADAYDVMTSARSYKKPQTHSAARQELTSGAGYQFDPVVVRAFLNVSLGRIEAVAGPFAWLFQLFSTPQVQIPVLAAAPTASGSGAIAVAALGFLGVGGALVPSDGPPDTLAMVTGVAADDIEIEATEDEAIEITLTADGGGGALRFDVDQPSHGRMAPEDGLGSGDERTGWEWTALYTPPTDFAGTDEVVYRACDVLGDCGTGAVSIEVAAVNDPPQANDDRVEGVTGSTFSIDVLANDFDVEGDRLTVVEIGSADNGLATVVDDRVVYLADAGFVGSDRIEYTITDPSGERSSAEIRIDVLASPPEPAPAEPDADPSATPGPTTPDPTTTRPSLPDPTSRPTNQPPVAVADTVTGDEDTTIVIDVLANDSDPEGDDMTIAAIGDASSGTATIFGSRIRYVPDDDVNGTDEFIYVIQDGANPPVAAAVTVTVTPVNDAPTLSIAGSAAVQESAPVGTVVATATATDIDGDDLTFGLSDGGTTAPLFGGGPFSRQVAVDPTGAFAIDAEGRVTVVAALDHETVASLDLEIEVSDGTIIRSATVSVTVADVNEAPTVSDDAGPGFNTAEDVGFTTTSVLANDDDPEGAIDRVAITVESGPANGILVNNGDGTFGYTPDPEWSGTDSFSYRITDPDSLGAGPATVTIVVADVNDAPTITNPGTPTGAQDTPFSLQLTGADTESTSLSYSATGLPAGLSITTGGLISGRPATDGAHTVIATVSDDGSPVASASTTFTIDLARHEVSTHAGSLVINEILHNSVSPTAPEEFVELHNRSATPIDLTGWTIDDANVKADGTGQLNYTIPVTDRHGRPSTLAPGEYAVVWLVHDGTNLPPLLNAAEGLEFVVDSAALKLADIGDDVWVLDPDTRIVDFVAYGTGIAIGTPPEAALGLWDASAQASLAAAGPESISLTPNGVHGNTSACWEPTGSGDAVARCAGATATVDSDTMAGIATSVGRHNNVLADAGGPYAIDEGDALPLDATGSIGAATFEWDLDGDGAYDDATGIGPTIPWAALLAAGIGDDGTHPIGVEVRTADGLGIDTASASVTITNVDPVLSVTGPATASVGVPYTLTLTDTDPGDDTITSWTIDWGDGTVISTLGDPASVSHTYNGQGFTHGILVSATDEDGTYFTNDLLVPSYDGDELFWFGTDRGTFVRAVAVNTDPVEAGVGPDGLVYVSGDGSSDVLRYNAQSGAFVDTFVTAGSGGISGAEGMAFGPDGDLYLADYDGDAIRRYDGTTGAHLGAVASALNGPYDVMFAPNGDLWASIYNGSGLWRSGAAGISSYVSTSPPLVEPEQIAFGGDGNLYIASFGTGQVLRFNPTASPPFEVFIDSGGAGDLDEPTGIAFGPDGHLYVADYTDGAVLRYDAVTGAFIDEYVAPGAAGLTGPALLTWVPTLQVTVEP